MEGKKIRPCRLHHYEPMALLFVNAIAICRASQFAGFGDIAGDAVLNGIWRIQCPHRYNASASIYRDAGSYTDRSFKNTLDIRNAHLLNMIFFGRLPIDIIEYGSR